MFALASQWLVDFTAAIANVIFLPAWESKHVNARYHNTCARRPGTSRLLRSCRCVFLSYSSGWRADVPAELSEKSVIFKTETRGSIFVERVYRPPLICRAAFEHREKFTVAERHRTINQSKTAVHDDPLRKFPFL